MPDPSEAPTPTPPVLKAVSPTGEAIIPPIVVKIIVPIVTIAGGIALAPTMGVDVSFLPPLVLKASALVAFLGTVVGIAGPGARRKADE